MMPLIEQGFTEKQILEEFSHSTINNYFTYLAEKANAESKRYNGGGKIASYSKGQVKAPAKRAF